MSRSRPSRQTDVIREGIILEEKIWIKDYEGKHIFVWIDLHG